MEERPGHTPAIESSAPMFRLVMFQSVTRRFVSPPGDRYSPMSQIELCVSD
jgi:hypothetical protein